MVCHFIDTSNFYKKSGVLIIPFINPLGDLHFVVLVNGTEGFNIVKVVECQTEFFVNNDGKQFDDNNAILALSETKEEPLSKVRVSLLTRKIVGLMRH